MVEPGSAGLESLTPVRRAVLVLLTSQNRSYSDIARLLATDESEIRDRAFHAAEELLADAPSPPEPEVRRLLLDYALGQQRVSERQRTRAMLAEEPAARAWLETLEGALGVGEQPAAAAPIAEARPAPAPEPEPAPKPEQVPEPEQLPEPEPVPEAAVEAESASAPSPEAHPAPGPRPAAPARISRATVYLLAGVIAIVIGLVLLLTGGGGGGGGGGGHSDHAAVTHVLYASRGLQGS